MEPEKELIDVLQSIPWFQELDRQHFDKLRQICHLQEAAAGEQLFHEGDKEEFLYIVVEGRVAIEIYVPSRGHVRVNTAEPMDVVGWSSITPVVRQRTAGARAVLPSRLVAIEAAGLRQLCDADHDLGYIVMRRMANVVASRLMTTRLQLLDMFANPPVEEGSHA